MNILTSDVTAIASGYNHGLAIQNGPVYAWGFNHFGQLGNGTTVDASSPVPVTGLTSGVSSIASGYNHSLAIQNGTVYAWGYNGDGQLGIPAISYTSMPQAIS